MDAAPRAAIVADADRAESILASFPLQLELHPNVKKT
jgi:hypothetical protein